MAEPQADHPPAASATHPQHSPVLSPQLLHDPWEQILPTSLISASLQSHLWSWYTLGITGHRAEQNHKCPGLRTTVQAWGDPHCCPGHQHEGEGWGRQLIKLLHTFQKGQGANFCLHGLGGCRLTTLAWNRLETHASQRLNTKPLHSDYNQFYGQAFPLAVYWQRDL